MRKIAIFIAVGALLLLGAAPALANNGIPKLPHAFYGSVTVNGGSAAAGTQVSATVDIGEIISTQNPVTTAGGSYGINSLYLLVQGYDIPDGATITFHVTNAGGTAIGGTATFVAGGGPTPKNLVVTIAAPPPGDGVGGVGAGYGETNLFGIVGVLRISATGVMLETITATSADGNLTITIPKGTIATKDGKPLTSLTAAVDPSPPDPPEGDNIIGLVYDFGPEGATFEPPITITFTYDPDEVAEDAELLVMEWDEDAEEWVEVDEDDYTIDTEANTVTLLVSEFSKYALIARAAPVPPPPPAPPAPAPAAFLLSNLTVRPVEIQTGELVTITVTVANTGGTEGSYTVALKLDGVKEAEKSVTVAAGGSEIVTFSASREVAGSYSVTVDGLSASFTVLAPAPAPPLPEEEEEPEVLAEPSPVNWALIGGIIAAVVVVVALLVYFLWYRRRAY